MKKKLADEIGKAYIRLHCSHWYWHRESPFEVGSFSRGVIVCNNCGKKKLIEQLKDEEVLVEPWRYEDYLTGRKRELEQIKAEIVGMSEMYPDGELYVAVEEVEKIIDKHLK